MKILKFLPFLIFAIFAAYSAAPGQVSTFNPMSPGPVQDEGRKGPVVEMSERSFNFGDMYQDQSYVHEFVIKNVGDAPLEIKRVAPG